MMPHQGSDAGFSLVETLVALFVVALLATSGGALLVSSLQAGDRVHASSEDIRGMEVMHALVRDDLAAMTTRGSLPPRGFGLPQGLAGGNGAQEGVVLSFVRNGWPRLDPEAELRSDLQRVEYRLQDGQLLRRAWAAPDPDPQTPQMERTLATGLRTLGLRYHDRGQWADEWLATDAAPDDRLPDMIEISVGFESGEALVQRFLVAGAAS